MSALWLLIRLKTLGAFRSFWRAFKTPQGAVRGVFILCFVAVLLLPLFGFRIFNSRTFPPEFFSRCTYFIDNIFPLILVIMLLMSLAKPNSGQSLSFQPSEIDYLFTAPFTRRELLLYKLTGVVTSTLVFSLFLTCGVAPLYLFVEGGFVSGLIRCYLAIALAGLLAQFTFIWSGLIRKSVAVRLITPLRRWTAIGLAALGIVSIISVGDRVNFDVLADPENTLLPAFDAFIKTPSYQVAITPMRMFSNLILSKSIVEAFAWASLCLVANGTMVVLILKTDEDFLERELHNSRMRAEASKKASTLEGAFVRNKSSKSLPMLPFMGGVGPITWRQLQTFFRMKQHLITQSIVYFAIIATMFLLYPGEDVAQFRFSVVITMLVTLTVTASIAMPMGFHTDSKNLEIFKSLPFSRNRIAFGQILGPVLAVTTLQYATIAIFMFSALELLGYWLAAALFAPLVCAVLLSVINTLALFYPKQPDDGIVQQMENIGHVLVFVVLLMLVGFVILGSLGAVGGLTFYLSRNIVMTLAACWFVMLLSSIVGIWMTGWAFERFDVSKHRM